MNMHKILSRSLIFSVAVTALILGSMNGCAKKEPDREKVTVSLYDFKLVGDYTAFVEKAVPEADIEWNVGKNTLDFYLYLNENDDLPDIMTSRRFSLLDAYPLRDRLLDLDGTELASSYHSIYLDKYKNEDGSVNWLPAPGIFDNIVANKKLFEEYDIPLPTDYDSFISACLAFEEHGIKGFTSDYEYDYTSMEIFQGLSIEDLSSLEGKTWRQNYENRLSKGLDTTVWPGAFSRVQSLIDAGIIRPEEVGLDYYEVHEEFINDRVAMIRGTGAIAAESIERDGMDVVCLPYLGSTEENNWALTYPVFQVAVSKEKSEAPAHKEMVLKVLDAMFSEEAQLILNKDIGAQISYNKNITLPLPEEMALMEPLIQKNHIYIRVASNEFFRISLDVFSKMMTGEYDADAAYHAFNDALIQQQTPTEKTAVTLTQSYSSRWDQEKGNEAGSCIANTVREALGTDVFVMPYYGVNCGIFAGDRTAAQLGYPVQNLALASGTLTGEELEAYLKHLVSCAPSAYQLPVVSGLALQIKKTENGFVLGKVTMNGKELSKEEEFSIVNANKAGWDMNENLKNAGGIERYTILQDKNLLSVWLEYVQRVQKPLEPEDYLNLK